MVFNTLILQENIDLAKPKQTGADLAKLAMPLIQNILQELKNGTLNLTHFPFTKVQASGLTSQSGLYVIANSRTKKIYLGGTSDLAQRKGDHHRNFTDPTRKGKGKLQTGLKQDLENGSFSDFSFIPVLTFDNSQVIGLKTASTTQVSADLKTVNQQIGDFLDTYVEGPLLNDLFNTNSADLYNIKQIGPFQMGNKLGGSPNSGNPSEPVSYETRQTPPILYAWESVSAVANCFNVDRRLVRVKRDANILKHLTKEQYANFKGTKISNEIARKFAANQGSLNITQTEVKILLNELFPIVAKKRKNP